MESLRRCFTININMPGSMENEHPHKFLKSTTINTTHNVIDLRPVEEFRNTPLIPISDK